MTGGIPNGIGGLHAGACCDACMKVAAMLAAEGRQDELYASATGRCCCKSPFTNAAPDRSANPTQSGASPEGNDGDSGAAIPEPCAYGCGYPNCVQGNRCLHLARILDDLDELAAGLDYGQAKRIRDYILAQVSRLALAEEAINDEWGAGTFDEVIAYERGQGT